MKQISLKTARRYFRRFPFTHIYLVCVLSPEDLQKQTIFTRHKFSGVNCVQMLVPNHRVFLRTDDALIAEVTEGLPDCEGFLHQFTGEFTKEMPY